MAVTFSIVLVVFICCFIISTVTPSIAPIKDNLSCCWCNGKVGLSHKQVSPILACNGLMLHVDVKDYSKFIVYSISHYSFKPYFFRHDFAILLIQYIVLCAPHSAMICFSLCNIFCIKALIFGVTFCQLVKLLLRKLA